MWAETKILQIFSKGFENSSLGEMGQNFCRERHSKFDEQFKGIANRTL